MAVNDILRATATFSGPNGNTRQWVWHYRQNAEGDPDLADVIAAILTLLQAIWAFIKTHTDNGVQGESLDLALYDQALDQWDTLQTTSLIGLTGDVAGNGMPGNVSPFITFFTPVGRSRGKKFLFDISTGDITDGALAATFIADMVDAGELWSDTVTVDTIPFKPGNFNQEQGIFRGWFNDQIAVGLFSGSQYRRLPGRGE